MQNNVNNAANSGGEAIKLLEFSSSDSLDSPNFSNFPAIKPKRKVRFKKVFRPGSKSKTASRHHKSCNCQVIEGAKLLVCFLLLALVAALVWYVITLSLKIQELQAQFNDIEAGNKNTPEALHSLHNDLQNLEANVTALFVEIKKNIADVNNATKEVEKLKFATNKLEESVDAAPALKQLPKNVESLAERVATFGSKISALESSVKELKDSQSALQSSTQNLYGELDSIKSAVHDLANATRVNSSDTKVPYMPLARDLTFQSAIQETKQRVSLLQNELLDLVRSVERINTSVTNNTNRFSELSVKVEAVNDAFIWINNSTHTINAKVSSLEEYVYYTLAARFDVLENGSCKCVGSMQQYPNATEIQNLVNKTITAFILNFINSGFQAHSPNSGSSPDGAVQQAENVLLLLRGLLNQFSHVPLQDTLTEEKAGEIFANLLNNTCFELHRGLGSKAEVMEEDNVYISSTESVNRGTIQPTPVLDSNSAPASEVSDMMSLPLNKSDPSFQVVH